MPTSSHTFAGADTDSSDELRAASSYLSATNIMLELGQVFPATGNVPVPGLVFPPVGTTLGLGGFADGSTGTAVMLYYNSAGAHRLVRYDPLGNAGAGSQTVLLEWAGLNLSPTLVMQGLIIESLLIYLDAAGDIRCINLARALAGGYTNAYLAAEPFALHVVKVTPRQVLNGELLFTNNAPAAALGLIKTRAYQFSYRYRYVDGETTVLAPFTLWRDILFNPATTLFDTIRLTLPPAPLGVQEIELLVREPEALTWQVADTIRRTAGAFPVTYDFYGQLFGGALTEAEAERPYEALWPCRTLGAARSRLFAADFLEGYPTPEPAYTATVVSTPYNPALINPDPHTFHESCTHRLVAQFYDAFGRYYGCSQPKTVGIPPQDKNNLAYRNLRLDLTTTGAAALNAEIPAGAYSVQFLFAPNDRTPHFIQGRAADVFAYFGLNDDNGDQYVSLGNILTKPHQQVAVNIGNFVASGQGYVWQPGSGDMLRFLDEQQEFLIVGQRGDYIFCNWTGQPGQGLDTDGNHTNVRIEIYSPNTTPSLSYYERGPIIPIVRTVVNGQEQRSYAQTSVSIVGDAFLLPFYFPAVSRFPYDPPKLVIYGTSDNPDPVVFESMVPPYRLAPSRTTINKDTGAIEQADLVARSSANLRWLDIKLGGRPSVVIPLSLQQVRRNIERFSGQKQQGNLVNGLSRWDALNQYDKFPQEQGNITALVLADQSQTDGSVLLTLQERGALSQYLGQQPIKTGADDILIATANQVVGADNTLKGAFGCADPATVRSYSGKVFYYCRERAELVRYHNGLVPLALKHKFRFRLEALTALYAQAHVTGCFDPRREEYLLTFHPIADLPGVTVYWSERNERWGDEYAFLPTAGLALNNELLTWAGPNLHRHAPDAPSETFFGVKTLARVRFVAAQPGGGLARTWQAIGVRSQAKWLPTLLTTPAGQRSRITPKSLLFVQGVWRAAIKRDENSPGFNGNTLKALHAGRILQSESLTVELTGPDTNPGPLVGAEVQFLVNAGQSPNQ